MNPQEALLNIKQVLNVAVQRGLFPDMDQVDILKQSFETVNDLVMSSLQNNQVNKIIDQIPEQ